MLKCSIMLDWPNHLYRKELSVKYSLLLVSILPVIPVVQPFESLGIVTIRSGARGGLGGL